MTINCDHLHRRTDRFHQMLHNIVKELTKYIGDSPHDEPFSRNAPSFLASPRLAKLPPTYPAPSDQE